MIFSLWSYVTASSDTSIDILLHDEQKHGVLDLGEGYWLVVLWTKEDMKEGNDEGCSGGIRDTCANNNFTIQESAVQLNQIT